MFIFKGLVDILSLDGLNSTLNSLGLPISNEKFQILLIRLDETELIFFGISFMLCTLFAYLIFRFLNIQDNIKN